MTLWFNTICAIGSMNIKYFNMLYQKNTYRQGCPDPIPNIRIRADQGFFNWTVLVSSAQSFVYVSCHLGVEKTICGRILGMRIVINFLKKCSIINQYLKLITQTERNAHLTCVDIGVLVSGHVICSVICHMPLWCKTLA